MSLVVDEHRQYLADNPRIAAYRKAIEEMVRPGDVVLDLASGTGILGLLACRAGAARVYSIELGGMVEIARSVARANGFGDRITFIKDFSTRAELPEKVDLVVSDQIGRFGFEAGVIQFFEDARKRFLKPGGRLIPAQVDLHVAAVEKPQLRDQVEFWNSAPAGFDFRSARAWAANTGYPTQYTQDELLSAPAGLARVDLYKASSAAFGGDVRMSIIRSGVLHGIGGWFSSLLAPGVEMTNSPFSADAINRSNVFLPIDQPVAVAAGDCVRVRIGILPAETILTWNVEVRGPAVAVGVSELKAKFSHSTMHGMLLSSEDLKKTAPEFVPRLTLWGRARRSVLELCDGHRPLAEIEREMFRRHSDLFPTPAEAAVFVAEVVGPYSL